MSRLIAQLRIEPNEHGDLLWIDLIDNEQIISSQAYAGTRASAERIVNALNFPEAVIVVDNFPPLESERIQRTMRLDD